MSTLDLSLNRKVVVHGVGLLIKRRAYSQAAIQRKLAYLGFELSRASLHNILSHQSVSPALAKTAKEGIEVLVQQELGWIWIAAEEQFGKDLAASATTSVVPEHDHSAPTGAAQSLFRKEGRLTLSEKVEFINSAQHEIVEFGLRLRTFSNYFLSRSAYEFRDHIEAQLEVGVRFKLYLIDPDCNEARMYFEDRSRVQEQEAHGEEEARASLDRLLLVKKEMLHPSLSPLFQIFTYKHIPYAHFFIADGEHLQGKMTVSPYLYGIRRADCPVIYLERAAQRRLFRLYYQSFQCSSRSVRSFA